jgi:hypothetical protein
MRTAVLATVAALILASCSPTKRPQYARDTEGRGYDFTVYTQQGFLFTPESYNGRDQSIGSLPVTVWPEMRREKQDEFDDPAARTGKESA